MQRTRLFTGAHALCMGIASSSLAFYSFEALDDSYPVSTSVTHMAVVFTLTVIAYIWPTLYGSAPRVHPSLLKAPGTFLIGFVAAIIAWAYGEFSLAFTWQLLLAGAITVLYYATIRIGGNEIRGIRSIAGLKNFALATAWTLATVPAEVTFINTTIVLQRFLFILILSLCVDLRDLQQDRSSGISTLTGLFGFNKSKFILLILCTCLGTLSFQVSIGNPTEAYRTLHTLSAALLMLTILLLRDDTQPSTYTLMFDGHLVAFSLALVLTIQS